LALAGDIATAAALAITRNANGDPKRMEASILALPTDAPEHDLTRTACLQDYFDLASMSAQGQGAAETWSANLRCKVQLLG
jgi:hypothetical protein